MRIWTKLVKNLEVSKTRRTIRALKVLDELAIQRVMAAIESVDLPRSWITTSALVSRDFRLEAEECLAQEAFTELTRLQHVAAMRRAFAGMDRFACLPCPRPWQRKAEEQGVPITRLGSSFLLWLMSGRALLRGYINAVRLARYQTLDVDFPRSPAATILEMSPTILPPASPESRTLYDYVSTTRRVLKIGSSEPICFVSRVAANSPKPESIAIVPHPFPPIVDRRARLSCFADIARCIFLGTILWMVGSWRAGFLLRHAVSLAYAKRVPVDYFARFNIFSCSQKVVRPLWTHYARKKAKSECVIVYYSVNSYIIHFDKGPGIFRGMGEALATWDHYVVPSRDLEIAIRAQARHTPRITRFPLIGTDDNGEDILLLRPKRCIAVFDVSSRRDRILSKLVYPPSIVSAKWVIKFHEDLAYCAKKIGCYLVVKQKREFNSSIHPKYRRFIQNMAEQDFVIFVNPRVAAARVAAKCAVTVALPFSTPAVYGRALGKPSVFYDPTGKIARHCTKFHDVPVASGRESLLAWLENVIPEGSHGKSDPDQLT